ncbi:glucose-6-phosphate dehydrogenase [Vallitalea okinawensis]|uniref:glucose-6-phosphate dehydrogenase n=1 Tax=Vallitalea okinawensis TaxID=2078660 RepID=UPI001A9A3EA5|nr:glucose-6-phosphate dehydrogenase [Vallitalea okinawensis]
MDQSSVFVIFGATGDLTHKKLIPALYNLEFKNMLPPNFQVAAIGRRDKDSDIYTKEIFEGVKKYAKVKIDDVVWQRLKKRITYVKFDFTRPSGYSILKKYLEETDKTKGTQGNRVFYLATAPRFFEVIVDFLNRNNLVNQSGAGFQRVVIEKPFGRDLESAVYLNEKISKVFKEEDIYRIDHYLGKEMIQNIMYLRFTNRIFDAIWNKDNIDNIQITVSETIGIENRGRYYEKSGVLKDMIQNHLSQILALVTMEPPVSFTTEAIRNEKVKVLKSLRLMEQNEVRHNVILGQYSGNGKEKGYLEEADVAPDSITETFAAIRLYIDNERWQGVPVYLRSGKRMKDKAAYISIQFKSAPELNFMHQTMLDPNLLVIRIQPFEGVYLRFNMKEPGSLYNILPAKMDFCQNCNLDYKSPEAYERLIWDVLKGDAALFTHWDEVESSWRFVESIITNLSLEDKRQLITSYEIGSNGPNEAEWLLKKDHRTWWTGGES